MPQCDLLMPQVGEIFYITFVYRQKYQCLLVLFIQEMAILLLSAVTMVTLRLVALLICCAMLNSLSQVSLRPGGVEVDF